MLGRGEVWIDHMKFRVVPICLAVPCLGMAGNLLNFSWICIVIVLQHPLYTFK